jgi:hypothetical protein
MDDTSETVADSITMKSSKWEDYVPKIGWGKTTDGTLVTWTRDDSSSPEARLADRVSRFRRCVVLSRQLRCKLDVLLEDTREGRSIYRAARAALGDHVEDPIDDIVEQQKVALQKLLDKRQAEPGKSFLL